MALFTDGIWYSGMTPNGGLHMFKSTQEEFMKIAAGGIGVAHHLLKLIPSQNPHYLPSIMNTSDPVLLNGRHFLVAAPADEEAAKELESLMEKHFNPPVIQTIERPIEVVKDTKIVAG